MVKQWYLLETEKDYDVAIARHEEVKMAIKDAVEHKEKMLLLTLIQQYEAGKWDLPDVDPVEIIKIRMEDFGYRPADLAEAYGDKGTVSKVLNYKQPTFSEHDQEVQRFVKNTGDCTYQTV